MKRSYFVPDDWELTDKLRQYARDKKLTEDTIDAQEERFRVTQFTRPILNWDKCWMRWILNAIEWGKVQPMQEPKHRQVEELTTEERLIDNIKHDAEVAALRQRRLKVVK